MKTIFKKQPSLMASFSDILNIIKQNLENSEPLPAEKPAANNQPAQNEPDFDLDIKIDENDF